MNLYPIGLNLTKTNYVIFRTSNRRVPMHIYTKIQIDGLTISRLQNVKFLGMINEFLNWNFHVKRLPTFANVWQKYRATF